MTSGNQKVKAKTSARATPDQTPTAKGDWFEPGLSFKCTQCGNCCTGPSGYVWFTDEEALAMAQFLNMTVTAFRKKYAHRSYGKWSLGEVKVKGQYDCVFLTRDSDGKTGCRIYPVRPKQCRTWPFWPSNLRSPRDWAESAKRCPGMKHGGTFVPADQVRVIRDSDDDLL